MRRPTQDGHRPRIQPGACRAKENVVEGLTNFLRPDKKTLDYCFEPQFLRIMKIKLLAGAFGAVSLIGFASAATVSISATAPTVDGADIANLLGDADAGGDQGHLWSNRPHQGQTFLTGSNAAGYTLNAVTMKNLNNSISNGPTFNMVIGSVSGTTLTQIGSTETAVAPNYVALDYITFTLDTSLTLAANTQYGFLWGTGGSGFVTVNNLDDNTYSGGTAISSGDNNVPDLGNLLSRNVDRVFHLDMTAIPEPSSGILGLAGLALLLRRRR